MQSIPLPRCLEKVPKHVLEMRSLARQQRRLGLQLARCAH